jgi:DNA-binding NarL/FixJ family response regulator
MSDVPGEGHGSDPPNASVSAGAIPVALIEDNRLVREGLTALLNGVPGLDVVAGESSEDIFRLKHLYPRVVLLDLSLENGDSLAVVRRVGEELPEARVIVMDLLPAQEDIRDFVRAGVYGFVMKDATLEELVGTIRSVASGSHVLPSRMTSSLFSQIASDAMARLGNRAIDDVRMTPREQEVVNLIAEGLSNKQMATRLDISTHTVKSHVRNVMEKLALHTRLQIAAWVREEGEPEGGR